jgi:acetolactate synthase-1/2/3 large subunit
VHHQLPVKVVIYNNSAFGLIHLEAESIGLAPFEKGIQFPNPDFAAFAQACGADGYRITAAADLRPALCAALEGRASGRPAVLDVPMVNEPVPTPGHWNITDIYRGVFG